MSTLAVARQRIARRTGTSRSLADLCRCSRSRGGHAQLGRWLEQGQTGRVRCRPLSTSGASRLATSPPGGSGGGGSGGGGGGGAATSSLTTSVSCGLVGYPNAGKSTLFNALVGGGAEAGNYPFTTIDPNVGVCVLAEDPHIAAIQRHQESQRTVPSAFRLVDIAGIIKGASEGMGLGNAFLANIRECDAVVQVVRCFRDDNVTHVDGDLDPVRDMESIQMELVLRDVQTMEKIRGKKEPKIAPKAPPQLQGDERSELLSRCEALLSAGEPARVLLQQVGGDVRAVNTLASLQLLSAKPVLYVANVDEEQAAEVAAGRPVGPVDAMRAAAARAGEEVVAICASTEADLLEIEAAEERQELLAELGLSEPARNAVARAAYRTVGLQSYYTMGPLEIRAWTVRRGASALEAAAVIHTDIAQNFIKAEVFSVDDLVACGSEKAVRAKGVMRTEGKEYVMREGDIVKFMHNSK